MYGPTGNFRTHKLAHEGAQVDNLPRFAGVVDSEDLGSALKGPGVQGRGRGQGVGGRDSEGAGDQRLARYADE